MNGLPTLEGDGVKVVKDDLFQLLVNFLLFPQDDIPLAFDGTRLQLGVLKDVAYDVDSRSHILLERLCVIDGLLPRRVSIQMSTEVFHFKLEGMLSTAVGSLEGHMFKEVGRAICCVRLGPRTSVDPNTDSRGLRMWVSFRGYGETIG